MHWSELETWRASGMQSVTCMLSSSKWVWPCPSNLVASSFLPNMLIAIEKVGFASHPAKVEGNSWNNNFGMVWFLLCRFGLVYLHFISFFSWFSYLLRQSSRLLLGGFHLESDEPQVALLLSTFWQNFRHECPEHTVFDQHPGFLAMLNVTPGIIRNLLDNLPMIVSNTTRYAWTVRNFFQCTKE